MVILNDSAAANRRAAEIIKGGGVIAFRTDTFYGLGADPFNASAVRKIKNLKGREDNKPILVLISSVDQLGRLVEAPSPAFMRVAQNFWPGALTIIGQASARLPAELTAGTKTVGVRLPDDDEVRALVAACGGALTATSANVSGEAPSRSAEDAQKYFGEGIDLVVDGGAAKTDLPSTVIDATAAEVRLIREGLISWTGIQATLAQP